MSDVAPAKAALAGTRPSTLVLFLFLSAVLAYIDRQFITIAAEVLHRDLDLTDVEIGLLGGPSFALCFAIVGLPISILVDRYDRVKIIALGMVCWSLATIACAFAQNFEGLFIARTFVGIGEAALAPAAYSLIGDSFERSAVPRATGFYTAGIALGGGLAILGGGPLIAFFTAYPVLGMRSWQASFALFGLLGLPLSAMLLHFVKDKRAFVPPALRDQRLISLPAFFGRNRAVFIPLLLASCLYIMFNGGFMTWAPSFFMRTFGWTAAKTGLLFGSAITLFSIIAGPTAGQISGSLERKGHRHAAAMLVILSFCGLIVFTMLGSLASYWPVSLACFALVPLFAGGVGALIPGMIVQETPPHLRGQMVALFLFFMTVGGYAVGPVLYAGATEYLFGGRSNLYLSLATLTPCILIPAAVAMVAVLKGGRRQSVVGASSAA